MSERTTLGTLLQAAFEEQASAEAAGTPLSQWVVGRVGEVDAGSIASALRKLDASANDARAARETGLDRAHWLTRTLESMAGADATGLSRALGRVLPEAGAQPLPIAVRGLLDTTLAGFGGSLMDDSLTEPVGELVEGSMERLRGWLEADVGSQADQLVSTVATVATLGVAREKLGSTLSAGTLAIAIDLGVSGVKAAYRVARGLDSVADSMARMADRIAGGIATAAGMAVEQRAEDLGAAIGQAAFALIGAAPVGAYVGRVVGRLAGPVVRPVVEEGLKRVVAPLLRDAASAFGTVIEGARQALSGIIVL